MRHVRSTFVLFLLVSTVLFLPAPAAPGQRPKSQPTPTEVVIKQYAKLVDDGALLTPNGWAKAATLFDHANPYAEEGVIHIVWLSGEVRENWVKGNRAEVESKYNDSNGNIDSRLRYYVDKGFPNNFSFIQVYGLVFTNKQLERNSQGQAKQETGDWEWRISEPVLQRAAPIDKVIAYVIKRRDTSDNPAIRKNANRTIAILKGLKRPCGSPNPC